MLSLSIIIAVLVLVRMYVKGFMDVCNGSYIVCIALIFRCCYCINKISYVDLELKCACICFTVSRDAAWMT